ncbi:MAG: PD-(D/E)XK nuclease family protein [Actinobacteria bacterium]|nr:PD-(D/E)XK nuclease family protein [Actinomycetota bacterium]
MIYQPCAHKPTGPGVGPVDRASLRRGGGRDGRELGGGRSARTGGWTLGRLVGVDDPVVLDAALVELEPRVLDRLLEVGRAAFARYAEFPEVIALWWPRFERIARWFVRVEASRENVVERHVEGTGRIAVTPDFALTARADRLDRMSDGSLAIIDYKTGAPPQIDEVLARARDELARRSGLARRALDVLDVAHAEELTDALVDGLDPIAAEAVYTARAEMATHLNDLLMRRTRLGLVDPEAGIGSTGAAAKLLAGEFGWSRRETRRQVDAHRAEIERERGLPLHKLPKDPRDVRDADTG